MADIRLVAVNSVDPMCQYLVVRSDAPIFKTRQEAFQWLNGKVVAAPKGSCADRFMNVLLEKEKIKPEAYLNQGNEVIVSNFRAKRLDAAVTWEPYIGKMVADGLVRIVTNGEPYNENNVTFVVMRADLIKKRPDVVKGWLNAELDAQHLPVRPEEREADRRSVRQGESGLHAEGLLGHALWNVSRRGGALQARPTFAFTFTP